MARPSADRLALLRALLAEKKLATPRASAIPRRKDRRTAPLSFAQERLFFLELYQPGTALHNDSLVVRGAGQLEPERLRRALAEIAGRHEPLRTSFALDQDGPVQRIHDALELPFRVVDLGAEPEARARADQLASEEARAPFDVERAPLWRATLARSSDAEWQLVLTLHHLISDGASAGILFHELSELYAAGAAGRAAPLAELSLQFGDYAAWERATLDEARITEQLVFWRRVLEREPPRLRWPASGGRPTQRGAQHPVHFPAELVRELQGFARAERCTTNQVWLAAFLALLHGVCGERDLCLALASSSRKRPELADLIGFFVQTRLLRADLAGDPDFRECLRRVRETALAAAEHEDAPLERVLRAAGRTAVAGPQVCFSHMKDLIAPPRLGSGPATVEFVDPGVARFELALILHESAEGVTGFFEYDLGVLEPARVAGFAASYQRLVSALLARPTARLSELAHECIPIDAARSAAALSFPGRARRAVGG